MECLLLCLAGILWFCAWKLKPSCRADYCTYPVCYWAGGDFISRASCGTRRYWIVGSSVLYWKKYRTSSASRCRRSRKL